MNKSTSKSSENAYARKYYKKNAKEIMSKHIIKEFTTIDFENYWSK